MFKSIRPSILEQMQYLEQIDAKDRKDETPRMQRVRQIPPETGKFLALLAANLPEGEYLEIGTSAGYSTLWITLACEMLGRTVTYEAIIPNLVPGGLLVADNAINHRETLKPMLDRAFIDERVDAPIVPIGKGELVCRKI